MALQHESRKAGPPYARAALRPSVSVWERSTALTGEPVLSQDTTGRSRKDRTVQN